VSLKGSFEYTGIYTYHSEVTEESGSRRYKDQFGTVYPSTTTVLSDYEDKTYLKKWAKKTPDAEAISAESARQGTEAHGFIEHYLMDGLVPTENSLAMVAVNNFYSHVNPDYVSVEQPLFYQDKNYRIAGRYDQLLKIDPDTFYFVHNGEAVPESYCICDLKTKRSYKEGVLKELPNGNNVDFLLKNCLQVSYYAAALTIQTDFKERYGSGVTGAVLIYVNEERSRLLYLDRSDLNYYWLVFKCLLRDYHKVVKNEKTWKQMISDANHRFNPETHVKINNIPKEIVAVN